MAMKSTVVIVAVTLALAILLAASFVVVAIERRGKLSLWPLADGPIVRVQVAAPTMSVPSGPD
jgi:hypothetical protein